MMVTPMNSWRPGVQVLGYCRFQSSLIFVQSETVFYFLQKLKAPVMNFTVMNALISKNNTVPSNPHDIVRLAPDGGGRGVGRRGAAVHHALGLIA